MSERLDACIGRKDPNSDKTYWTKIGAAFPSERGGYFVVLDAMPAPQDGQYKINLFVPKPREERDTREAARNFQAPDKPSGGRAGFDDDIPFSPQVD